MQRRKVSVLLLVGTMLALAACNDSGRPTAYNKGVYGGKADTKLTPEQVRALRHRGMRAY